MNVRIKKTVAVMCSAVMMLAGLAGCGDKTDKKDKADNADGFKPALDTEQSSNIEISGFLGNFEALDQVVNDFNQYYPNVTITYEQTDMYSLAEYLKNNDYVDIFMTTRQNVDASAAPETNALDYCLDMSDTDIDISAIDPELIDACRIDGGLVRIPLAKTMCGLVVNKTLLEEAGLDIPQTYSDFLSACETLKNKGYTPIQSSKYHAGSDLVLPMAMTMIAEDEALTEKVKNGDSSYAEGVRIVYERLKELIDRGYMSAEVNETYPEDNYDQAILKFLEGDVPFWVANTESASGIKKRETKSEAFSKEPFEYEFIDAPLADNGVYDYEEPWSGFSVNKNSDNLDYALEFMRFLTQEEELNKLASIKGMPSVTVNNDDERFADALNPEKCAGRYIYDGELGDDVTGAVSDAANKLSYGELETVDDAIDFIKNRK